MRQTTSRVGDWNYYKKSNLLTIWKCWIKRSFWGEWLYRFFPFGLITILIAALIYDGVFVMGENRFSFIKDSSNSICMIFIFILSYFLGATYPQWIERSINALRKYQRDERTESIIEKTTICVQAFNLFAGIGVLAGIPFVSTAKSGGMDWIEEMSGKTHAIYNIFLGVTWYISLELLIYVISGCFLIYKLLETKTFFIWDENFETMKQDIQAVAWLLNITVSYSIFYVMGAFVIIINDNINAKYGLELTFYKYPIAALGLVLIMIIGLLCVIVTVKTFRKVVEEQKSSKLIDIENRDITLDEKELLKNRIYGINSSIFQGVPNKILVVISAISPLLSFIVQKIVEIVENIFIIV